MGLVALGEATLDLVGVVRGVPGFGVAPPAEMDLDRGLNAPLERGVVERGVEVPDENEVVREDLRAEGEDTVVGGVERNEDVELLRIEVTEDLRARDIVSEDGFLTGTRRVEAVDPEREAAETGVAGEALLGESVLATGLRRRPVSTRARTLSTRGLVTLSTRDRVESTRGRALSALSSTLALLSTLFRSPLSTLDLTPALTTLPPLARETPTPTPVCTRTRPAPTPTSVVRTIAWPSAFSTTDSSDVSLAILERGGRWAGRIGLASVEGLEDSGEATGNLGAVSVAARTRLVGRDSDETVAGSAAPGTINTGNG